MFEGPMQRSVSKKGGIDTSTPYLYKKALASVAVTCGVSMKYGERQKDSHLRRVLIYCWPER